MKNENIYTPYDDGTKPTAEKIRKNLIVACVICAIITIGIIIVMATSAGSLNIAMIITAFFIGCTPFGWHRLNSITPKMFLFLPIIGWLIYFMLKFALSATIGPFVFIPRIINDRKIIAELR